MIMRLFRLLLAVTAMTGIADGQGVLLSAGDFWNCHFSTLDYVRTDPGMATFGGFFTFSYTDTQDYSFPTAQLQSQVQYDVYEGEPPNGLIGSSGQPVGGLGMYLPAAAWQDLEGSVRFTVLTGSFSIDSLTFTVWRPSATTPSSFDTFQTTVTLVPEPSTWALWLGGCSVFWLYERRRLMASHSHDHTQ